MVEPRSGLPELSQRQAKAPRLMENREIEADFNRFRNVEVSPDDAAFLQARRATITEIAEKMRLPEVKLRPKRLFLELPMIVALTGPCGIPARSGLAPGRGMVKRLELVGESLYTASDDFEVLNAFATGVGPDAVVFLGQTESGLFVLSASVGL
jgi:hypothetical protein